MTIDEMFREYEEALARIDEQACEARKEAKATLHGRLKALQIALHEELKAVRVIQQRTKGKSEKV